MYGFNVLGLNPHNEANHSKATLATILKDAPENLNSFKEVSDAIKELQALEDPSGALKEYLNSTEASKQISSAVDQVITNKNYVTQNSLAEYAKLSDIPSVDNFITSEDLPDYTGVYQPVGNYLTEHQDISGKQNVIPDLDTIKAGAALGATALQEVPDTYALKTDIPSEQAISNMVTAALGETVVLEATTESGEIITFNLVSVK